MNGVHATVSMAFHPIFETVNTPWCLLLLIYRKTGTLYKVDTSDANLLKGSRIHPDMYKSIYTNLHNVVHKLIKSRHEIHSMWSRVCYQIHTQWSPKTYSPTHIYVCFMQYSITLPNGRDVSPSAQMFYLHVLYERTKAVCKNRSSTSIWTGKLNLSRSMVF